MNDKTWESSMLFMAAHAKASGEGGTPKGRGYALIEDFVRQNMGTTFSVQYGRGVQADRKLLECMAAGDQVVLRFGPSGADPEDSWFPALWDEDGSCLVAGIPVFIGDALALCGTRPQHRRIYVRFTCGAEE